jgi:endonuclease III
VRPLSKGNSPRKTALSNPRLRSIRAVDSRLSARYRDFAHHNKVNPLSELLYILCSTQTDELKYTRSYAALRARYRSFHALRSARTCDLERLLAPAGLSRQKARAIKAILTYLQRANGKPSLAPLRGLDDDTCERMLTELPHVGKKTARCVMMYSLGRKVFPVDTHCWRICRRLGWIEPTYRDGRCSQADMDRLQALVPPESRYTLHVNMVSLGREICLPAKPRCADCPVRLYCRTPLGA